MRRPRRQHRARVEQADGYSGGNYHRYIKRRLARLMRRWGKRDLEDAPQKNRYSGWES